MKKLAVQAFAKAGAGLLLCALLLFGPAGTLHWAGAWRFLAALFLPMVVVGVVLPVVEPLGILMTWPTLMTLGLEIPLYAASA